MKKLTNAVGGAARLYAVIIASVVVALLLQLFFFDSLPYVSQVALFLGFYIVTATLLFLAVKTWHKSRTNSK